MSVFCDHIIIGSYAVYDSASQCRWCTRLNSIAWCKLLLWQMQITPTQRCILCRQLESVPWCQTVVWQMQMMPTQCCMLCTLLDSTLEPAMRTAAVVRLSPSSSHVSASFILCSSMHLPCVEHALHLATHAHKSLTPSKYIADCVCCNSQ